MNYLLFELLNENNKKTKALTLKLIKIETTSKELTHLSGLTFFNDLITRLNLVNRLGEILPKVKRIKVLKPKEKFFCGIFGFIAGADCIDDLDSLRSDYLFSEMTAGGVAPSTMRSFLGRFRLKYIAGKIVSSARKVKLRLSRHNWEVYERMMLKINETKQRYVPYKTLSELFNNRILERPT